MMTQAAGFIHREFQNLLGVIGKFDFLTRRVFSFAGQPHHHFTDALCLESHFAQDTACDPTLFFDKTNQQMFSPNQIVACALCFLVSQAQYSSCSLCKAFHASHKILLAGSNDPGFAIRPERSNLILPRWRRNLYMKMIRVYLQKG